MQLNRGGRRTRVARLVRRLLVSGCLVAPLANASQGPDAPDRPVNARADTADESAPPEPDKEAPKARSTGVAATSETADEQPGGLRDSATERAAFEMAVYDDNDGVTVFTPSLALGVENTSGATLRASYLVDIVSAASADIVSTASPRWQEVRQAGSLYGEYKPHDFGIGVGGSISHEPDYDSFGAFATVRKDFSEKNWSLFFGYGFGHDTAGRCGADGACTPFSVFSRDILRASFNGGFDLVADRASLLTVTGDVVVENGDQSKPYRYVPIFRPEVAATIQKGASAATVNAAPGTFRSLEQLPLSRRRLALTGRYARRIGKSTLRLMERLYDDTWGLMATSTDARVVFDLGKRFAFWPHARFHFQHEVNFWQLAYVSRSRSGWDLPEYRTGDRELGPLWTAGAGFGVKWYFGGAGNPEQWALQLTADGMYTSFLNDLYLTSRIAGIGALGVEGSF